MSKHVGYGCNRALPRKSSELIATVSSLRTEKNKVELRVWETKFVLF